MKLFKTFLLGFCILQSCSPSQQGDVVIADVAIADVAVTDVAITDAEMADVEVVDSAIEGDAGDGFPLSGFGLLTGDCNVLDDELILNDSFLIQNVIDFEEQGYEDTDAEVLTEGGREVLQDGNAGGSSLLSEVFAFEVLKRCESATLLKTETEIAIRDPQGPLTDLLVELDGKMIGVSVTRAIAFPFQDPYTQEQARALLEQKLQGVLDSSANVAEEDRWEKQILFVMAFSEEHVRALEAAYTEVSTALKSDTVIVVTESRGDDIFLYEN